MKDAPPLRTANGVYARDKYGFQVTQTTRPGVRVAFPAPVLTPAPPRKRTPRQGCIRDVQWQALCATYGYRCIYCGEKRPLTKDHVIPRSKGGAHTIDNIVPACRECNHKKADQLWPDPREAWRMRHDGQRA